MAFKPFPPKRPQRPKREKKSDHFISPDARPIESQCHASIAPMDRMALQMDAKWGVDRLVELVSPETASKYGSALGRLNEALRDLNAVAVARIAGVCIRGMVAMDKEATEAGHEASPLIGEYDLDGFHFGIVERTEDWKPIAAKRPDLKVFSLREIAVLLKSLQDTPVDKIKEAFPGAAIKSSKLSKAYFDDGGDDIPF